MELEEFNSKWGELAIRFEQTLGVSVSEESHPLVGWLHSAKRAYLNGHQVLASALMAYAQFALEDMERVKARDESLYRHFKRELRRNLPHRNYFGLRQELRMAASLLEKRVSFVKSETPDFKLHTMPVIGIECTSLHLSLDGNLSKGDVAYKVDSAISKKSECEFSSELQVLAIDTSNLLFHEGVHDTPILSQKNQLFKAIGGTVNASQFQSVLTFAYAWQPTGIGRGVTLTNYYSRVDRADIAKPCKQFLDTYYPLGNLAILGHLHKVV